MHRDQERIRLIQTALHEHRCDAIVCALPTNVLLLSGYWPFIGAAIAIATRDGQTGILSPNTAEEVGKRGWPDELETFELGSLTQLRTLQEIVREPLANMLRKLGLSAKSAIAYEDEPAVEPSTYAAMNIYGAALPHLLDQALPGLALKSGAQMLSHLRAILTHRELVYVREACGILRSAYESGRAALLPGATEIEVASSLRVGLSASVSDSHAPNRADGFVYCMSGPNSAHAWAAYQRSTRRQLQSGDFALVHCNSYVNGYWTDFTRTFSIGQPSDRMSKIYDALRDARDAALAAIRPGARASEVDRAARDVLASRGFGAAFKHPTGHGVGFSAIDHLARPRIHPKSTDILESGMVFNIEPAVYIEGFGGARHCDMVAVTSSGADLLTPFLEPASLALPSAQAAAL